MSSFRRFVFLATGDVRRRNLLLHRIDMTPFFLPKGQRDGLLMDPPPLVEAQLPPAAMRSFSPFSEKCKGSMNFMLLAGSRDDDKVVATDQTGCTLLYDAESDSVCTLCSLTEPKYIPISLTINKNLYILDKVFNRKYNRNHCFDGLIYDGDSSISEHHDWYCHSLPPPPYVHSYDAGMEEESAHVTSYSVVGGSNIWISKNTLGTHSFNVASRLWTKVGNWALPFYGQAIPNGGAKEPDGQYVPEHNLWFGLTCGYGEKSSICASDLTETPPKVIDVCWKEFTPPGWISKSSHLVHLGSSKFCHARFFEIRRSDVGCLKFVVFTGIEVQRSAEAGGKLFVLKHRSERYSLHSRLSRLVL